MELSPIPIGIGPVPGGGACNRELRRIPIPRTPVNKGQGRGRAEDTKELSDPLSVFAAPSKGC